MLYFYEERDCVNHRFVATHGLFPKEKDTLYLKTIQFFHKRSTARSLGGGLEKDGLVKLSSPCLLLSTSFRASELMFLSTSARIVVDITASRVKIAGRIIRQEVRLTPCLIWTIES